MAKKRIKLSDQIRAAVDTSGLSRYRICQLLDINQSTFSRFINGGWLGQENMNALAELLGLSIFTEAEKPKDDRKGSKGQKG